jgi:hypothetical protein
MKEVSSHVIPNGYAIDLNGRGAAGIMAATLAQSFHPPD